MMIVAVAVVVGIIVVVMIDVVVLTMVRVFVVVVLVPCYHCGGDGYWGGDGDCVAGQTSRSLWTGALT